MEISAFLRFLFVFACPVLWATGIISAKYVLELGEDPVTLMLWSSCVPLVYWLWHAWARRAEVARVRSADWRLAALIACVAACSVLLEMLALRYGTASGYALLVRSTMLFTFVFAYFILGERLERAKWPMMALLLLGTVLVVTDGHMPELSGGDLFALAAAASIALGNTVLGKKLTRTVPSMTAAALTSALGIFPIIGFALYAGALHPPEHPLAVGLIGIVVLLGTMARYNAYAHASAGYISMMYSFTPIIVAAASTVLLHERLSGAEIAGGVLVVAAGIWTARAHK